MSPTGKWENEHNKRLDSYAYQVEQLYRGAVDEIARVVPVAKMNPDTPFSFDDYPALRIRLDLILSTLASNVQVVIGHGISGGWNLANSKVDELVSNVFADASLNPAKLAPFNQRNLDGLAAFQARTANGLTLSNRVWTYSKQLRGEVELGIDAAITEGVSASKLATTLKKYLSNPDDLFRRVRSTRGNLVLSKHAAAYHPGSGIYRSSYKNAQRVARTEINASYRTADYERYQQLPFVVGIKVQRSNNTNSICDVCPSLVGVYPKEFLFTGWHPACRCYTTTILSSADELRGLTRSLMNDQGISNFQSKNKVKDVPANYVDWIEKNRERLRSAKNLPSFITDNPVYSMGLSV